ncbi:4-(cytidine 5'-diphospho)-2-C-methyl-D-erythritol kinase [Halothiobacillus sp. DCM-1]|uniref:4-(cytidine 5'-diphospho)-2-C-methyl-D-erythritol kinase n=1 Tax=Halothiobacillus sp. DCM-1 TaxID=3112558 RepID=UPI00325230C7
MADTPRSALTPSAAQPEMVVRAPIKLNLFLHINGRITEGRFQGYHQLQTYFQRIDYGDVLRFSRLDADRIVVDWHPGDEAITHRPTAPEQDLIWRAAEALRRRALQASIAVPGVHIHLTKNAPIGGGLGGGSSAAGTTLRALNDLWRLNFPPAVLLDIGRTLGADVPVFVAGLNAWAEGIGDQLIAMPSPVASNWFVIIAPAAHCATKAAFAHPLVKKDTPRLPSSELIHWKAHTNAFEAYCLTDPVIAQCYAALQEATGFARVTGSGACVFSPLPNEAEARRAAAEISRKIKMTGRIIVAPALADDPLSNASPRENLVKNPPEHLAKR